MLLDDGVRLVKLFMHITPDEQMRRFRNRLTNPLKRWKLSYEDFRNRGRWTDYEEAIEDMMEKTSTRRAPWHLVPANDKSYGRLAALRVIADRLTKNVSLEPRPLDPKVIEAAERLLGIRLAPPAPAQLPRRLRPKRIAIIPRQIGRDGEVPRGPGPAGVTEPVANRGCRPFEKKGPVMLSPWKASRADSARKPRSTTCRCG